MHIINQWNSNTDIVSMNIILQSHLFRITVLPSLHVHVIIPCSICFHYHCFFSLFGCVSVANFCNKWRPFSIPIRAPFDTTQSIAETLPEIFGCKIVNNRVHSRSYNMPCRTRVHRHIDRTLCPAVCLCNNKLVSEYGLAARRWRRSRWLWLSTVLLASSALMIWFSCSTWLAGFPGCDAIYIWRR